MVVVFVMDVYIVFVGSCVKVVFLWGKFVVCGLF